jgi:hypothetical protein
MVHGGLEMKFRFIQPVMKRVRFLYGRIGNLGCIQVRVDEIRPKSRPRSSTFRQL